MKGSSCLIVGCGDIGIKLAQLLRKRGAEVWGLRRNSAALPTGIHRLTADVTDATSLEPLRAMAFDFVVVTLTPAAYTDAAYASVYVEGFGKLLAVLKRSALKRVFFVSSTSVYHQGDGGWVDEESPVKPQGFSGQRLLQAEQLLADSGLTHTVIRFAGIYGPGRRRLIEQVREGQGCPELPALYTNRIHRDDCVGLLAHLMQLHWQGQSLESCYIGADSEPVTMWELKHWLAQQLQINSQHWQALATTRRNSKRCSNRRMLASGYQLIYPGYRQGYGALLRQEVLKPLL